MFRARGFSFRKTVANTVMVRYILHASVKAVLLVEQCVRYFNNCCFPKAETCSSTVVSQMLVKLFGNARVNMC